MGDYELPARGPLKLKIDGGIKKKKKKDKKDEKKILEQINNAIEKKVSEKSEEPKLTNAERAFLKQQEKLQKERIMQKASMTHKQRVEEFNRHLDSLTEHFDIPKVSWTK